MTFFRVIVPICQSMVYPVRCHQWGSTTLLRQWGSWTLIRGRHFSKGAATRDHKLFN